MSAHVLLNLLNELPHILSLFCNEFLISSIIQEHEYYMTLRLFRKLISALNTL